METHLSYAERESLSPTCSFNLFDCFSARKSVDETPTVRSRTGIYYLKHEGIIDGCEGVERDMAFMYQQPHLLSPMKLTVFDELPPPTPPPTGPSHVFSWVSHTKSVASKVSERTSFSVRRMVPTRPLISSPKAAVTLQPATRRRGFRPLELSIYLSDHRLSDLPEFNRLSFTDVGDIKFPAKALLRTTSEACLYTCPPIEVGAPKPASMFERRTSLTRQHTCSSVISTSRPPSEYDALHSHPVSWASLPGLPPQINMAGEVKNSVTIMSPMQEEFTPPASSNVLDNIVMDFPTIDTKQGLGQRSIVDADQAPAPSPTVPAIAYARKSSAGTGRSTEAVPVTPFFHTNYQTQKRISQWLANRSHSSSVSTVKTTASSSTSSSFAEHRRKRSQFYMLSGSYVPPPKPLHLESCHQHQRSMTVSTVASTINTDIMSMDEEDMESMTTAPTASEIQSRSGTIKSVNTGRGFVNASGLRPIVSGIPDLPGCYGEVVDALENEKEEEVVVIKEINGSLRSPMGQGGVGLAF